MKLLKYLSISFCAVFIFGITVQAQTADEIIEKHIKAHGGKKKWDKVESLKISGKYTSFSSLGKFKTIKKKPGKYYSKFDLGHFEVIEADNGKNSWTIDPWQEITFPRRINRAEQNVFNQKAELCTPFFNYKEKGHKVEYIGKDNVEGTDVYVLKLTRKNSLVETWYLDMNTHLEVKCISQWIDFAYPQQAESFFDDFRKVDGLIIPHYTERIFRQRNRVIEIEKAEINIEVDDRIFEIPTDKNIEKLNHFIGDWHVVVEAMTRRGTWYKTDSVSAKIIYADRNLLQTEISYQTFYFPMKNIINWNYNSNKNKYQMSVYNDFYSVTGYYEGNFKEDKLIVNDSVFRACDTNLTDPYYRQFEISKADIDNFAIVRKLSNNKGESWFPNQRFRFIRKK